MRYDCTRTKDFAHEGYRMCKSIRGGCDGCPIHDERYNCDFVSTPFNADIIDIVQGWSDTHPEILLDAGEAIIPLRVFDKFANGINREVVAELQEQINKLQNKNKEYIETIQVLKKDISKKKQIISELREE